MPTQRIYPLSQPVLAADRLVIRAMKDIPDYSPRNPDHSVAALQSLELSLQQAEDELTRLSLASDAARKRVTEMSWALHEGVLGAKAEVIAQFGADSHAVAAMGLTRKSERKRPTRRSAVPSL